MRKFFALGLIGLSGYMLFQSGMAVYSSLSSSTNFESHVVELDRIEGKNCPLFFPKER